MTTHEYLEAARYVVRLARSCSHADNIIMALLLTDLQQRTVHSDSITYRLHSGDTLRLSEGDALTVTLAGA